MELTTSWQTVKEIQMNLTGAYLQVQARYTSQSTTNNTTDVEARLRLINASGTAYHCYTHSCNFNGGTFDGSDYKGSYYHGWESNTTTTILSQSKTITHNSDGTKSFNLGGYFTCSAGVGGTVPNTSVSLPKINRRSVFSINKPTFDIGDIIQATITQYVSAYHQDLYIVIGGNEVLIQSSASGTVDIETNLLANMIYQQIPNAKYYENEFRLKTLDSSNNLIGTYSINYRANVVDSEPTFDVAYQDTNATTTAITLDNQKLIQNKSTLQVNITNALATHYSSLASVSVTINGVTTTESISTSTKNINIGTLNLTNNTNAIVRVTDSRGFYTEKTLPLTILEWYTPNANITLKRQQNFYSQTDITVDANYSYLDGNNTITIEYRYKKASDNTWSSWASLSDNVTTTFTIDNLYAWNVQVRLTDKLASFTYENLSVGVGNPILFVDRKKYSVGINCLPKNSNTLEINGKTILDLIHPIGSIYISIDSTNPGTLFGGTWEAFATGRTLVGIDTNDADFSTVSATGGSKGMQQHTHTIDSASLTGSAYNVLMDDYNPQMVGTGIMSIGNSVGNGRSWSGSTGSNAFRTIKVDASHSHTMQNAGTGTSGNLQPYIVVYMWKRVS